MGAPSIYVYDCSNAGMIVSSFKQFAEEHEKDYEVSILYALTDFDLTEVTDLSLYYDFIILFSSLLLVKVEALLGLLQALKTAFNWLLVLLTRHYQ